MPTTNDYRNRSLANLLRMGHCAPTVMQTMLDFSNGEEKQEWLVKLSAGMPGGIGNTGHECGGLTSPLVHLGLRYGLRDLRQGLPLIFYKGIDLFQRFLNCNQTLMCTEIRKGDRLPLRCIPVISHSPQLYAETLAVDGLDAIPDENREAYRLFYAHLTENGFHCAHAVFQQLGNEIPLGSELLEATSAFLGGTCLQGLTCSAFAAGVMAVGLKTGEIEDSPRRVIRMIAIMATGGNAFGDEINQFNKTMNRGYRMSKWFRRQFGSTQCRAITGCDFATPEGVKKYIEGDQLAMCRSIAGEVAKIVQSEVQNVAQP
jgi:hypothetical protein